MNLIVETDIGRDPDDFFALCYLIDAGVNIRAITISPGDSDQVAVVKFLLKEVGLDIPVGVGKLDRNKSSVGGMHVSLLQKYGFKKTFKHDGYGPDIMKQVHKDYPDSEFFAIGPLMSLGKYIKDCLPITRATMQGGFVGYDVHGQDVPKLDKFKGLQTCSTFNLGGDVKGGKAFISSKNISERNFVGKNICHTILYNKEIHKFVMSIAPKSRAGELLREGMGIYLKKHPHKKFHDPSAAVCMLHPEIATWIKGNLYYDKGKWGTWGTIANDDGDNKSYNFSSVILLPVEKNSFN